MSDGSFSLRFFDRSAHTPGSRARASTRGGPPLGGLARLPPSLPASLPPSLPASVAAGGRKRGPAGPPRQPRQVPPPPRALPPADCARPRRGPEPTCVPIACKRPAGCGCGRRGVRPSAAANADDHMREEHRTHNHRTNERKQASGQAAVGLVYIKHPRAPSGQPLSKMVHLTADRSIYSHTRRPRPVRSPHPAVRSPGPPPMHARSFRAPWCMHTHDRRGRRPVAPLRWPRGATPSVARGGAARVPTRPVASSSARDPRGRPSARGRSWGGAAVWSGMVWLAGPLASTYDTARPRPAAVRTGWPAGPGRARPVRGARLPKQNTNSSPARPSSSIARDAGLRPRRPRPAGYENEARNSGNSNAASSPASFSGLRMRALALM